MSITSLSDWGAVELAAQTHELQQVETPKVPEMPEHVRERLHKEVQEVFGKPTIEQQLIWATTRCAELQIRLNRKDHAAMRAIMYLSIGETTRASEELNKGLLDL